MAFQEPTLEENQTVEGGQANISTVVRALCDVVSRGVDVHRCVAARALGRIGDAAAVETLTSALRDEDEDVRVDAATALGLIGDASAGPDLLENLIGDPCTDVKLAAIDALTTLRHAEAAPWLRKMLAGRDEEMAWDEESQYHDEWDDWTDLQVKAIKALAGLGDAEAVEGIVAALDDEYGQDLTTVAYPALAKIGGPGTAALAECLNDTNPRIRRRAAKVLAHYESSTASTALERALADQDADVRLAAAQARVEVDIRDPRLTALFDDGETELRVWAVNRLGAANPEKLRAAFDDNKVAVQAAALYVLAANPAVLGEDETIEKCEDRLASQHSDISAAAVAAICEVAPQNARSPIAALVSDGETPLKVRLAAITGLGRIGGDEAQAALTDVLSDEHRSVRLQAVAALGELARRGSDEAKARLLDALAGTLFEAEEGTPEVEPDVQAVAEEELAEEFLNANDGEAEDAFPTSTLQSILGEETPEAVEFHKQTEGVELSDRDIERLALTQQKMRKKVVEKDQKISLHADLRQVAARQLCDLADDQVAEALAAHIDSEDMELRQAATDSLARLGERMDRFPDGVQMILTTALNDQSRDIRMLAARALGNAGDATVELALLSKVKDDDAFVRKEAVIALGNLGHGGETALGLLQDDDPGVRTAAAQVLAKTEKTEAIAPLVEFAVALDGFHCRESGRLLRRLNASAANAGLLGILTDEDRRIIWAAAIEALEEINRNDTTTVAEPAAKPLSQAMV